MGFIERRHVRCMDKVRLNGDWNRVGLGDGWLGVWMGTVCLVDKNRVGFGKMGLGIGR